MKYPVAVIIATKDREAVCYRSIESICSIGSDEIQLVVSDNSATRGLESLLMQNGFRDAVDYAFIPERITAVENYNRCLERVDAEYVCMIGDDDTVTSSIVDAAKAARRGAYATVIQKDIAEYYWPTSKTPGCLILPRKRMKRVSSTKEELAKLERGSFIDYQRFALPRLYHGLVSFSLLEAIRRRTGAFIGGLSPDIYTTVALSLLGHECLVTAENFSIAGVCEASASALSAKGLHSGELSDYGQLSIAKNYRWSEAIPAFFSVETVWAESAMQAYESMTGRSLMELHDLHYFLAYALLKNRRIGSIVLREAKRAIARSGEAYALGFSRLLLNLVVAAVVAACRKFLRIIARKATVFQDVESIQAAQALVSGNRLSRASGLVSG